MNPRTRSICRATNVGCENHGDVLLDYPIRVLYSNLLLERIEIERNRRTVDRGRPI
ncbi:hypothetical protein ASZ90_009255 [hydrocarbon metagenome]|uniref:Uncharacterized protein n=1 Tax=hydrocarbon metagenome TaxID=938273 RepID=A0A0W8FJ98_9ZZZZ